VDWVLDGSANISVYVDNSILTSEPAKGQFNIAWFAESSAIIGSIIEAVKNNYNNVQEKFDMFIGHDLRLQTLKKFKYVPPNALPWIQNKQIYKKNKKISMIGSAKTMCPGHNYRQQIIQEYSSQIDHYGRGFGVKELPWTYIDENQKEESGKLPALKDYYFSIAMENDNYDTIYCEKLTDCFATGTIPIFWGSKKVIEIFNPDGIIFLDENFKLENCTKELYYSKMDAIKENFDKIHKLLSSEDYLYLNYLQTL
jgi:hypothetical protein